ncbi:MAG: amidohydrolase [Pseudohongiellaceae bacterium]
MSYKSPHKSSHIPSALPVKLLIVIAFFTSHSLLAQPGSLDDEIARRAGAIEDRVIAWRRDIHQHPELSNREFRTAELVAEHLRALGLEVETEVAYTGVVATLVGGLPGPTVALRADMDALPVVEQSDYPFRSTERTTYNGQDVGVMHACGHDTHVAILMGAAEILSAMREQIPGTIRFIFQPAEEGAPPEEGGGARMMVDEGVLLDPDVEAIFGLHITQSWAVGEVGFRPLGMMASAERFDVNVRGSQTHAARPWAGVDPIVVSSQIVMGLQTIISRQTDITQAPAVITVGTFHGGVRNNIIPDDTTLTGTIRTFDPDMRENIHERMRRTINGIARSAGASAELVIYPGVPVTFNDAELTEHMRPTLERLYGSASVNESPLITGAEDFSFYQEEVPGFFFFIGGRPLDVPASEAIPNHSPRFYVDEDALLPGVRAMSTLAVDYLHGAAM